LAVKVRLAPGEERTVPFVLAWDFPVVRFGQGTEWWKKYTEYFDVSGRNGLALATETLADYPAWEAEIDRWQKPVLDDVKIPMWLKTAAFNELYYTSFGGSFYAAGLKSQLPAGAKRLPSGHPFFEMECMAYPFCNTLDVRHYSSVIYARFWPEIERDLLLSWSDAVLNVDPVEHQVPHDSGSPTADPFFAWDHYGTQRLHWKDLPAKFIQQCWRYWHLYQDRAFLDAVWPACKAAYTYLRATDTDEDGLPNNSGSDNTYDSWGLWGTSLLCGGLWVGALEAMQSMAEALQDPLAKEVPPLLTLAREQLDSQLWDPALGYYHMDTGGKHPQALMADGLNGQRYCEEYGLPDILPAERIRSHLQQVYARCVVPLRDFNGDGIGECGALNGVREDGGRLGMDQSDEIWTGASYFLAASMYHAGLCAEALHTAFGVAYLTYAEESTAYWFNTPEAWLDGGQFPRPLNPEQYQRPRAVWELLLEISDPYRKN
jgi:non-lysosomal glucosylceramidase